MAALFGSLICYKVYLKMVAYQLPILEEWQGTHGPLGINPPQEEMLVQKVISIEARSCASDWTAWYEKAADPAEPGRLRTDHPPRYDDDEMRGATFDHADWGAAGASTIWTW